MTLYQPVTHVIFDLDGTLLDTEGIYFNLLSSIIKKYGHEYTSDLRTRVMGTREQDTARIIIEELGLPLTVEEFMNMQTEGLEAVMPSFPLLPGAERLIRHLHGHGIPLAVATSSSIKHMELKMAKHRDLFSCMHHLVSGTNDPEVHKGKPAPDIFLVCAGRFPDKPPVEKILVFEDAPNGVVGARAAGMQCVMVPEGYIPDERKSSATIVLNSLEEFQPEHFGLPPF